MAARNGHTKCVIHLLQNGGNVLQRDCKDRNCLMIAIQNHHKYVNIIYHVYSTRIRFNLMASKALTKYQDHSMNPV